MVEHFSKWIELVQLLDKSNKGTTYAFLDWMLHRFRTLIEVLTN